MGMFSDLTSVWRDIRAGRPRAREKMRGLARREALWGLFFLSPWIAGFLAFYLLPMIASLVFTFMRFDLSRPEEGMRFIGLANYAQLFRDPQVRKALVITLRFMIVATPVTLAWPLFQAVLLNAKNLLAKQLFRTLYYLPFIVPVVSVAYIWRGFLNTETGWMNRALQAVGLCSGSNCPEWLNSVRWIYITLILVGLWGVGDAMLRLLGGMQTVPTEYYEAARVDGANALQVFWRITLPMISPMVFYNLILLVVGLFQYFALAWILGGPNSNPNESTLFYNVYLYKQAFVYSNMGYAATLAWILLLMALVTTLILFGTAKYWVYYVAER